MYRLGLGDNKRSEILDTKSVWSESGYGVRVH